ncbi:MAG TPA: alpha-amylase family glycosyl hydrolase [Puia sp.]|nr:alpha-amylase family glycosyl hydrolase [Puia sp.]
MSFSPVDWSYNTNIYEVNLRQYTDEGTFIAFARSLERLRNMGIETLWFMPVTPISQLNRKGSLGSYYACSDYTTTNPEFGTLDEFRTLVREAQQLGFKVLIDWVANHTGWDHRWTREHPEYYVRNPNGNFIERNGWDDVIDLDYNNQELRRSMISAMRFWIDDCHIDGFRCDMAHLVPLDFWIEARTELDQQKRLFWLAECEVADYHLAFDASYTWRWMHKTEDFARDQTDINGLWELLSDYNRDFPPSAFRAYFTSNHDENTWNGTEYEKFGPAAKNLAVFSSLWNGIPLIYSGQEIPNLKRLKFFDRDPITWPANCDLQTFYKTLLSLRKKQPALRAGDPAVTTQRLWTGADNQVFAFKRCTQGSEVLVFLNYSTDGATIHLTLNQQESLYTNAFDGSEMKLGMEDYFNIPAWNFIILKK